MDDRWFTVKSVLEEKIPKKGASEKWLRDHLSKGLRHARVGGKILIKGAWIDEYFQAHETDISKIDTVVDELLEGFN